MTAEELEQLLNAYTATSVADWLTAGSAVVTSLIAAGALIFAASQVKEAKATRELTRQLEVERAQPNVVAFTEPSSATNLAIDLVIKNFGATPAYNVRIDLEPWPQRENESGGEEERVGIPQLAVLAPGQEWRTSWSWGPNRHGSDLPDRHEGELRYLGINRAELKSPVVLDLGIYKERTWIEVRGVHDAANALREIDKKLGKVIAQR